MLDIGGGDAEEEQLYQVRGALRLDDGTLAVANSGTQQVRFYGPEGGHLMDVGGEGQGPGEFRRISWLHRSGGDTLMVYDSFQRRATHISASDGYIETFRFDATDAGSQATPFGLFDDGSFLARGSVFDADVLAGPMRWDMELSRYGRDGALLDSIGRFAGTEVYLYRGDSFVSSYRPYFGRGTEVVVHGAHVYVGVNDTYEISVYRRDGANTMLVRREYPLKRVTDGDLAALKAQQVDGLTAEQRRRFETQVRDMPASETMPAFGDNRTGLGGSYAMYVDATGHLWVQEYRWRQGEPGQWSVFTPDGQWLGQVDYPEGFRSYDIGPDFVLGVWQDVDDVEHVRLYELIKPE
jgi:hypothetical protein